MSAPLANNDRNDLMRRLITQHESQIRMIIGSRSGPQVRSWTTIDDIFQETVAAAIAAAHGFTYGGEVKFLAWIRAIAMGIVSRSLKDRERRMLQGPSPAGSKPANLDQTEVMADGEPGPSSILRKSERAQAVRDAIDGLPERYRKVLTLYKLEERPLGQVAAELGCTKGATARLIDRALRQLRTRLRHL